jgi:hypothetical protein
MDFLINPALRAPGSHRHAARVGDRPETALSVISLLGQVRGQVECFGIGRRVNLC